MLVILAESWIADMDGCLSSTVLDRRIGLALPNVTSLRHRLLFSIVRIYRH